MSEFQEYLPSWATGTTTTLCPGAQLCTRDGRRIGNAVIIGPQVGLHGQWFWPVLTDAGTKLNLMTEEVQELFFPPTWLMNPTTSPGATARAAKVAEPCNEGLQLITAEECAHLSARTASWQEFARTLSSAVMARLAKAAPVASASETFVEQIAEAKRDIAQWPQWMQDAAHVSAAVAHPPAREAESAGAEPAAFTVTPGGAVMLDRKAFIESPKVRAEVEAMRDLVRKRDTHPPAREAELSDEEVIAECERIEGRTWWTGGTWLYPGDTVVVRRAAARGKG